MTEEWFNRRPSQNVYKNGPSMIQGMISGTRRCRMSSSTNSTYSIQYRDYHYQFTTVADRWLEALRAMGEQTPWRVANVDHRGWFLQTMTPYDGGVHEPEAAGALPGFSTMRTWSPIAQSIASVRVAMEFLDSYGSNPSYELQLVYGTYSLHE